MQLFYWLKMLLTLRTIFQWESKNVQDSRLGYQSRRQWAIQSLQPEGHKTCRPSLQDIKNYCFYLDFHFFPKKTHFYQKNCFTWRKRVNKKQTKPRQTKKKTKDKKNKRQTKKKKSFSKKNCGNKFWPRKNNQKILLKDTLLPKPLSTNNA